MLGFVEVRWSYHGLFATRDILIPVGWVVGGDRGGVVCRPLFAFVRRPRYGFQAHLDKKFPETICYKGDGVLMGFGGMWDSNGV